MGFPFVRNWVLLLASKQNEVTHHLESELGQVKERLLTMASHAEAAVNRAVRALLRRDDELARLTKEEDRVIDQLEKDIDEDALKLLARQPTEADVRLLAVAMKISHHLERVGDEATTISRRCLELCREPQLQQTAEVPCLATLAVQMLKDALDAFVNGDTPRARGIIPRDTAVDGLNKRLQKELAAYMSEHPTTIERCLNLMVIFKSLERIADHAKNIAEEVVYLYEGRDIRHGGKSSESAAVPAPAG